MLKNLADKPMLLYQQVEVNAQENDLEMMDQVSDFYAPGAQYGIRRNGTMSDILRPPVENLIISEKDRIWTDFLSV